MEEKRKEELVFDMFAFRLIGIRGKRQCLFCW